MQAAKQDALDTMQCASPTSATQRQNSRNLLIFGSRSQKVGTTTLFGAGHQQKQPLSYPETQKSGQIMAELRKSG